MHFYELNICRVMIFCLYTVCKKHDDDENWQSNQRKIPSIIASDRVILLLTVDWDAASPVRCPSSR